VRNGPLKRPVSSPAATAGAHSRAPLRFHYLYLLGREAVNLVDAAGYGVCGSAPAFTYGNRLTAAHT